MSYKVTIEQAEDEGGIYEYIVAYCDDRHRSPIHDLTPFQNKVVALALEDAYRKGLYDGEVTAVE